MEIGVVIVKGYFAAKTIGFNPIYNTISYTYNNLKTARSHDNKILNKFLNEEDITKKLESLESLIKEIERKVNVELSPTIKKNLNDLKQAVELLDAQLSITNCKIRNYNNSWINIKSLNLSKNIKKLKSLNYLIDIRLKRLKGSLIVIMSLK